MSPPDSRAYLTAPGTPTRIHLHPTPDEKLAVRTLTQGATTTLTRHDTNPGAVDSGGRWWRTALTDLYDRGLVTPTRVHLHRAVWHWTSPEAELTARRLTRNDPNLHYAWYPVGNHTPQPPTLAELVALIAWDLRYEPGHILDIDATNPTAVAIHEAGTPTTPATDGTDGTDGTGVDHEIPTSHHFDWEELHTFARFVSTTQEPGTRTECGGWYSPARLTPTLRAAVYIALRDHATRRYGEPRLRLNLTTWTLSPYGQPSNIFTDHLCADAKDALLYLQAPPLLTREAFLRWATNGGLHLRTPCSTLDGTPVHTTLRLNPTTRLVDRAPNDDPAATEALAAAHTIRALTDQPCPCTTAHTILTTADPSALDAPSGDEPGWASTARAMARIANAYALTRP